MGYRLDEFAPGEIYHVFTRGVEKRPIFLSDFDRIRFLNLSLHYLSREKTVSFSFVKKSKQEFALTADGQGLVDILCYCLMQNHVHFLLRENVESGISTYMRRLLNAYAKYFNLKNERSGPLFLHPFKAVRVDGDEHFLHVSRYIHLNPYVAHLIHDLSAYKWSSLNEYLPHARERQCHTTFLRSIMAPKDYQKFVVNDADYERSLSDIQHLTLDIDD